MKILHVTECFAGGVATAINMYASLAPEHEHMVLYTARRANSPAEPDPELFSQSWRLPDQHRAAIETVRRVRDQVAPDVIHAHSSFAGAYVRLARLRGNKRRTPTVYTPHGVAFARKDISALHRAVFYSAEWALSWVTSVFAPCGQWEEEVLRRLNRRIPQVVIPNATMPTGVTWNPTGVPTVAISGRVTPQRSPELFAAIARRVHRERPEVEFQWLGGGDADLTASLQRAGVHVTGWLDKDDLYSRLARVNVGLHTALWDGYPMAVLEMNDIGVPVLVQDIPALQECPAEARFNGVDDAARKVIRAIEEPESLRNAWEKVQDNHSVATLADALHECYSKAGRN